MSSEPMNAEPTLLELQAETLHEFLRTEQQRQSQELLERGRQRAEEILRNARRTARARMREAVSHERARLTEALSKARASQQTEQRKRRLAVLKSKVDEAWSILPRALQQRWQQSEQRLTWCLCAVDLARKYLQGASWQIYTASGLGDEEQQHLASHLRHSSNVQATIAQANELRAGLTIATTGAHLDASISGLLHDRQRIEGLLVAEFETAARREP